MYLTDCEYYYYGWCYIRETIKNTKHMREENEKDNK